MEATGGTPASEQQEQGVTVNGERSDRGSISLIDASSSASGSLSARPKTSAPPSAAQLAATAKWMSVPRSVVLEDTRKTASLYPKNATMSLRALRDPASASSSSGAGESVKANAPFAGAGAVTAYQLQWWESVGLQLVSPNKPPSFQVSLSNVVGVHKEGAKLLLDVSDTVEALRESSGRKIISFRSVNADDTQRYFEGLQQLVQDVTKNME